MGRSLAQKILQMHCNGDQPAEPGQIVQCRVSSVLANDITAPLAIEAVEKMGGTRVFDPERVYLVCDHFTPNKDVASAEQVARVRRFAEEMGITHYYEGGSSGVEHALLPELGLVGPGDVVVGADSHTCTYGGLGAFATGLGSTDVAAAMVLGETWFKVPPSIRVELGGSPGRYIGGKDIVLSLIGRIGVDGALYKALEFAGPALEGLDVEARMTVANMAIEAGGKAGLFPSDQATLRFLRDAGRSGDRELHPDEGAEYERVVSIDVGSLEPQVAKPHLPENVAPVRELSGERIDQVVIGSCTNGRISDLRQAAAILQGRHAARGVRLIVIPATPQVYARAMREGLLEIFMNAGGVIGPPTCGPCLGGHMGILGAGERCLATTNRNFKGRMGSSESEVFLAGPAVAAATAVSGTICHPDDLR
jgi:3-isopropylmalate/(R)-2-methylmalate dehydratase large subunit